MKFHIIKYSVSRLLESEKSLIVKRHEGKLDKPFVETGINDGISVNPNEVINNLSGRPLSDSEVEVLKLGLKHGIALRPREDDMIVIAESIWEQINRQVICQEDRISKTRAKTALKAFTSSYLDLDFRQFSLDSERIKIIKSLHKELAILKPDKGTEIVAFKLEDYNKCTNELFSDETCFKKVN